MKLSIWDILTGVVLLGILCMIGGFGAIILNPNTPLNPLQPAAQPQVGSQTVQLLPTIALPSATPTSRELAPTWTPVSQATKAQSGAPTLRPTSTPVPTFTPVILPTFTPSRAPRTGVGGGSCSVTRQIPEDGTYFLPSTNFDASWTIKNNSGETWRSDSVDIRFASGDRMHLTNNALDLPYDVSSGAFYDLTVHMKSPAAAGGYTSNWQLVSGDKVLCQFFITIRVQ